MADASTALYALVKPEVGASADTWGGKLNANADDLDTLAGAKATTGSANAYVLTTGLSLAAYVTGQRFTLLPNFTNSGAATLNVDGLGAKNIYKNASGVVGAVASGDIVSGIPIDAVYDGTQFVVRPTRELQPLDPTLTALAALSWSSGNALVQFTAADTVSLTLTPSVTDLTLSGALKVANGTSGTATGSIYAAADTNTGITFTGSDVIQLFTGGSNRISITSADIDIPANTVSLPNGSVSSPAIRFRGDNNNGIYYIGTDNWGLSAGGSKIVDIATTGIEITGTFRARTPTSAETSGTLTSASANKVIAASGGITIDGNVFTAGDSFMIYAGASSRTLTQGSTGSPTQRLHGSSTTGNLTLAARGVAVVYVISATEWVCSGDVS